jgi:hypothetical protein
MGHVSVQVWVCISSASGLEAPLGAIYVFMFRSIVCTLLPSRQRSRVSSFCFDPWQFDDQHDCPVLATQWHGQVACLCHSALFLMCVCRGSTWFLGLTALQHTSGSDSLLAGLRKGSMLTILTSNRVWGKHGRKLIGVAMSAVAATAAPVTVFDATTREAASAGLSHACRLQAFKACQVG